MLLKFTSLFLLIVAVISLSAHERETRLELTPEERDWIIANPVIRVGMDAGFPPANFWDENGVLQGIDADFLAAITELTGLQFEFVRMDSWIETVAAVRIRDIDMITSVTRSPSREEFLAFTEVYYDFPIAIITRSDSHFLSTPAAMRGQKVAVPEGFVTHEVMESIGWEVDVMRVPTITDAYLAVSTGQSYATVANLGNASYLIPRLGITNLKISGVMPEFTRSRFAVRKDWAILAGIIDKYFASVSEIERSVMVERWVRLEVAPSFNWSLSIRIIVGVVLFGGGILLVMLWRNRQLRQQLAERARYQTALEEAHERVSLVNEEKSDLLHMVAHDMRGPLMTFQTGVGLVQQRLSKTDDWETSTILARMDRQTEAMQSLVDGLLDVEAIENGSRHISRQPVDLRALVDQVLERAQEQATRKEIAIEWSAPVGAMKALGDMVSVRQIIENILSNALKYSPIGGRVALRLIEHETSLQLEVQDNGSGISPDEFPQLFVKFSRLSARPTDGESSHGLGLYIVKRLIETMNGKVWCESQLGKGSIFFISLPRDQA